MKEIEMFAVYDIWAGTVINGVDGEDSIQSIIKRWIRVYNC